ncbi:MAG: MBL fold metallo-hydrolase [Chloroflexia bacterium]
MQIRAFVGGPTGSVGYLVYDHAGGSALIVDAPLGMRKKYMGALKKFEVTLRMIVNTHGHWDQIADNAALIEATGAELCAHSWDATRLSDPRLTMEEGMKLQITPSRAQHPLHDGEELALGDMKFEVMHTPGHSPGSICLYERSSGTLFSGDTLLRLGVGRTDLPGGNAARLSESLRRLALLPDDTRVYPSHGLPTTILAERWLLNLAVTESPGI